MATIRSGIQPESTICWVSSRDASPALPGETSRSGAVVASGLRKIHGFPSLGVLVKGYRRRVVRARPGCKTVT